jgi:hypothetical protein
MKEAEQAALAEQALSEFEVAYGFKTAKAEKSKGEEKAAPPKGAIKQLGPEG